ncbi:hypothetical protein HS041_16180 [Planomonospora sp. ID67723]|uniref:hypothetical protein n=1 Tax=Planomonospora sp. ID67723 TaxID=2738134 RepID=UPI0018C38C59|nr:hypothetical protein [Planomonospora sp. ID67723]MBG0829305.1 hypothetical protein [Planomonospora sp. ID67723]
MFRTVATTAGVIVIALSSLVACSADDEACAASVSTAAAPFTRSAADSSADRKPSKPKKKKVDVDIDDCD